MYKIEVRHIRTDEVKRTMEGGKTYEDAAERLRKLKLFLDAERYYARIKIDGTKSENGAIQGVLEGNCFH